ncbi:hypothetical protein DRQ32_06695, partial [bacterium]
DSAGFCRQGGQRHNDLPDILGPPTVAQREVVRRTTYTPLATLSAGFASARRKALEPDSDGVPVT